MRSDVNFYSHFENVKGQQQDKQTNESISAEVINEKPGGPKQSETISLNIPESAKTTI